MVRIHAPDGSSFCIDKTEVTRAQYFEFFSTEPFDVSKVPAVCNPQYWQDFGLKGGGETGHYCNNPEIAYPKETGNLPVECANWCNAKIFCEWAGKRLCGGLGTGKSNPPEDANNPTKDEWLFACTQGGKTKYAMGDTYVQGTCNESSSGKEGGSPVEGGAMKDCHGQDKPFNEVYDLMGNVREWTGNCQTFPNGFVACGLVGFDWVDEKSVPSCGVTGENSGMNAVGYADSNYGIRCCAD